MKYNTLLTLGLGSLIAISGTASAEKSDKKGGHRKGEKIMKHFDTDGDGVLSESEKEAMETAKKEREEKMLALYDADQDGALSKEEKKTARAAIKEQNKEIRAAALEKFDADGDGKLSKDERSGMKEWVKTNYPDAILLPPKGERKRGKKGQRPDSSN